MLLPVKTVTE